MYKNLVYHLQKKSNKAAKANAIKYRLAPREKTFLSCLAVSTPYLHLISCLVTMLWTSISIPSRPLILSIPCLNFCQQPSIPFPHSSCSQNIHPSFTFHAHLRMTLSFSSIHRPNPLF